MEWLFQSFHEDYLYYWEDLIGNWFFWFSVVFLMFELLRYAVKRRLSWDIAGDVFANAGTFLMFTGIIFLIATTYVTVFFIVYEYFRVWEFPITGWALALCIILADVAYYWEHRAMHRFGIGWATHAVHHSSPHFNISVAYRFGPLDGILPIFFHLPLALIGFHPFMIFLAEMLVQLYQTALHTESVGKLPKFVEATMNTPSHHRVHHGSNRKYLDKNYAGIFIIWDKMFGTFEEEDEKVVYGLTEPINTNNPLVVFFCGFTELFGKMWHADSIGNALAYLIKPPGWSPKNKSELPSQTAEK
jgi:sterol desaturase/sphingolipid hydroxylase (fatty acid hydroxylase superfamily)